MSIGAGRWWLKKLARRATVECSTMIAAAPGAGREIRAITYHRFGRIARDPFCVAEDSFERQMAWIAERGLAISLGDLARFLVGDTDVPSGGVLVTIDDGFRSLHDRALPILRRHAIPAVAFVSPGLVGQPTGVAGEPEPYATWDEISQWPQAGVTVASHAMTHRSLAGLDESEVRDEAMRSREELERRLGATVEAFAYPFGTLGDFTPATVRVLGECGYRHAFTSQHGAIRPAADGLTLPRVKVESGDGQRAFEKLCAGGMDAWRWVDRALWRLQRPDI